MPTRASADQTSSVTRPGSWAAPGATTASMTNFSGQGSSSRKATSANSATKPPATIGDRKSTRLNSSHVAISYAVSCLKKKQQQGGHIDTERADEHHQLDVHQIQHDLLFI